MTSFPNDAAKRLLATAEAKRLHGPQAKAWRRFGPYLSERQWGTVREDYSANGDAWEYFSHEDARSRAYRWGEDGIAGFSDDELQRVPVARALERPRPLPQGTPVRPHQCGRQSRRGREGALFLSRRDADPFLSAHALQISARRGFLTRSCVARTRGAPRSIPNMSSSTPASSSGNRYFDVTVEYAKAAPDDILMRVTITNQAPEAAKLHVLPQLFTRNIWSWETIARSPGCERSAGKVLARHPGMEDRELAVDQPCDFLFCENETNVRRLFGVEGKARSRMASMISSSTATRRRSAATRARNAPLMSRSTSRREPRRRFACRFRQAGAQAPRLSRISTRIFAARLAEADEFYAALQSDIASEDAKLVQRQALAGMIWSKQYYNFDVRRWLAGRPCASRRLPVSASPGAIATGSICRTATSCRCPTPGNIPGTPHGICASRP